MTKYVIRRVVQAIPVLFGISIAVYAILLAAPGGPTAKFAQNPRMTLEQKEQFKKAWGLDQPIPIQYCRWIGVCNPDGPTGLRPASSSARHGWPNFLPGGPRRRDERRLPRRLRLLDRLRRAGRWTGSPGPPCRRSSSPRSPSSSGSRSRS